MVSPQEYQEQLIKFRYLREQRDMYQSQLEIINASRANVINSKNTLEHLKEGVEEDDEILVPIGGIVNIKASIKEPEKVLLAVNQDVVIEKDLTSAIEFLNRIIEQHNKQIEFLGTQLQNLDIELNKISQVIQRDILQK
ncbi:MAG: prefoldin subunit alpha [Candidatus Hodarchaeota archaeon]